MSTAALFRLYTADTPNGHNGAPFTVGNATDDGKGRTAINLGLRRIGPIAMPLPAAVLTRL